MQRFRWIALQGSSRGFLPPLLLFYFITTSGIPAFAADVSAACSSPVARVVSIQGSIEVLRTRQNDWSKVTRLDTPLCAGDRLRAGVLSRAALFIQPETLVRVDQNTSITVNQNAEEMLVEFTQAEVLPAAAASAYSCGAGYFITRFPRKFRVKTPHLNAAVEGTEFLVAMRCESTELSVFEGKVLAASTGANIFPTQSVVSGQTLTIGGSEPPVIKLHLKPTDAVQWTLYYPPITPAGVVPAEDCRVVAQDTRVSCLVARAEQLLRAGRVDEAQTHIGDALAAAPYSSDAKALSSIISLVRNDKAEALRLAKEAVEAAANSAPAWLALSYSQQADFELEGALTSAQRASELTPSSALAFARVAELQLSLGWTREAEKTAKQAVAANPSESRAHMILGFVHLAQISVRDAREDFERAIELDSTEPLSRLGLGLAIIRKGNLKEGREQIEIAVALDPTNSLLRSYVGKAYYEENTKERDQLASIQFGLAKKLDPKDPTPWFYDAILSQTQNRPVRALIDLHKSIDLNENRAVYRSNLFLDQDSGSRTVGLARTFSVLGFEDLALNEAAKSLAHDPNSSSAHRFLADAYTSLPRHDIARQSELLQSQLTQPVGINPASPLRVHESVGIAPNGGILRGVGPANIAFNEFTPLFERDGSAIFVDGVAGEQKTFLHQIIGSTLKGNVTLTAAEGHFETDGFGENADYLQNAFYLLGQVQPTTDLSLLAEVSKSDVRRGETLTPYDPVLVFPLRIFDEITRLRVGVKVDVSPTSSLMFSGISQTRDLHITSDPSAFDSQTELNAITGEMLFSTSYRALKLVAGTNYLGTSAGPAPIAESRYTNTYSYINFLTAKLTATVGLSWDNIHRPAYDLEELSPKAGLIWTPKLGTTLRAAAFQTVKRELIGNQTIEPTQVAGFNQFFDDPTGAKAGRYGIGLQQSITTDLQFSAEASEREVLVPVIGTTTVTQFRWRESLGHAFLYWSVPKVSAEWSAALKLGYEYEKLKRPEDLTGTEAILNLDTKLYPLGLALFSDKGFEIKVTQTNVQQTGLLQGFPGFDVFHVDENGWVTDAEISYLLPRRLGRVSLVARNLFDEQFDLLQDSDPTTPRFTKGRLVYARLVLEIR